MSGGINEMINSKRSEREKKEEHSERGGMLKIK